MLYKTSSRSSGNEILMLSQISMRGLLLMSFWFAFQGTEGPRKGAVLLRESRNCLPLENIASSFSEPRLVSRMFVFRDLLKATQRFCLLVWTYISVIEGFTSAFRYLASFATVFVPSFLHHHWIIAIYCSPCFVEFEAEMWLTA